MKYRLKDLCSITKGAIGIMKADGGKYPLVALSDERRSHSEFQFDANAVIVPLISSTGHGHASMKRVHYQEGKFALGNILCAVIPNDEKQLNAKFLHLYLQQFKEILLVPLMKGAANVSLPMNKLGEIEIEGPDLVRQLEIIALEDEAAEYKNELEEKLILQDGDVVKLRQALLKEAMQGKLTKRDATDSNAKELLKKIKAEKENLIAEKKLKNEKALPPITEGEICFEIPENWTWCRLSDVCTQIVDCPHSTPKYLSNETGYFGIDTNCIDTLGQIVRLRNLSKEGYEERVKRLVPTENDIVYAREGSIGLAAFIPKGKNICLGQRVMLFRPANGILPAFLKMIVTEETYKNKLLEKHRGMGAKHVNVRDIISSLIPLPPLAEQIRIVNRIVQLMQLCDELQFSIQQSKIENAKLLQGALKDALRKQNATLQG